MKQAIVLVGGKGTRLRSVVSDVPKPMAPVAGRPFLSIILDELLAKGIRKVCLATCYMEEKIMNHYGDSYNGMEIVYSSESKPCGTGGAICQAAQYIEDDIFLVLNGDSYSCIEYGLLSDAVSEETGGGVAVALGFVDDTSRYGRALFDASGRFLGFSEKGESGEGWINIGCYAVRKSLLAQICNSDAFSFEEEVFSRPEFMETLRVVKTQTPQFIDIGVPEDYEKAQQQFG